MQTAITYERISTTEQSRHSLSGQRAANVEHCERNGWYVINSFSDESTGSNFDRPGWKDMLSAIKKHRPNYVVVMKYDRLSRNASESLGQIEQIEAKYGCRFVSVTEALPVSEHSPFYFKMRADLLVNAQFELKIIKDRTQFGRVNAAKQGRFSGPAPFGYENAKDASKKPILVVNHTEADIIREMYQNYISGMSYADVAAVAKGRGFSFRHKDAVQRILKNPIYCGKIVVPPYAGNEAYITNGIHEPIVDDYTYWKAQTRIVNGTPKKYHTDEEVYLRGVIYCETCGKLMTSCRSRGNGGVFHYYFCHRHPGKSYRVENVHADLEEVLRALSFDEAALETMQKFAREEMEDQIKKADRDGERLKAQIRELDAKIHSLEEKFINNAVGKEMYDRWKPKFETERIEALDALNAIGKHDAGLWREFEAGLADLGKLDVVFASSDVHAKKELLSLLFGQNLVKTAEGFRTEYVMPYFLYKALQINKLQVVENEKTAPENGAVSIRTPYGGSLEPILGLLSLFQGRRNEKVTA